MKKNNKKFEEEYFQGWFKGAVGNFTHKDLVLSKRWFWAWLKKLQQYVPLKYGKGKAVLEIGSSIGGVAVLLQERGFTVYASDISEYAAKNAKKISPKLTYVCFDVRKEIPLKKKFDLILAFEVVEHLENPEKALKNMMKVLKKNGRIVFSTPYPYSWSFSDPTHINVKYPREWVSLMKKVGLSKVEYHRFSLVPFFYRFHERLQIIIPFPIPIPYINNPIFYIGKKI